MNIEKVRVEQEFQHRMHMLICVLVVNYFNPGQHGFSREEEREALLRLVLFYLVPRRIFQAKNKTTLKQKGSAEHER